MSKFLHQFLAAILILTASTELFGQTTLNFTFNDASPWSDGIAEDGEGGASDFSGQVIQILNISNTSGSALGGSIEWHSAAELANSQSFSGLSTFNYLDGFTPWKGMAIKSSDGTEFKISQFKWYDWNYTGGLVDVIGYRNTIQVASTSFTANSSDQISTVSLGSDFDNVDEVRITYNSGSGYPSINNIIINKTNRLPVAGLGTALNFERSRSEGVQAPNHSSLNFGTGDFTIEAWVKRGADAGHATIVGKQNGSSVGYYLRITSNKLSFEAGSGFPNSLWVNGVSDISDNNWHHVAAVLNTSAKTLSLYIDGILDNSSSYTSNFTTTNTAAFGIGYKPGWGEYFDGSLDDVRIWSTARSAAQIKEYMYVPLAGTETGLAGYWNFEEGSGTSLDDRSANSNTGTLQNSDGDEYVAGNTTYSASVDENSRISLRLGGSDVDDQSLAAAIITTLPSNGKIYQTNNGTTKGAEITAISTSLSDNGGNPRRVIYEPNSAYSGSDSFSYKVNDGTSNSSNTQTVSITVVADITAPTISSVTSSTVNGTYKAGDALSIQVNFSEAVTVTGTPQLTLETGTTDQAANYISGSGTTALTFTYTVQSGDASSDLDYAATTALALNSGTIKDAAGNSATLTLATPGTANSLGANKNIIIDTQAPAVAGVTSSTANGTYIAGNAISIQVNFSEAVTVTGTPQLTLETGTTDRAVNYASGSGTSTLTFTYTIQTGDVSSDLDYTSTNALALNSGTIKDAAGNSATLTLATPGAANSLGSNKNIVIDGVAPTVSGVTSSTANGTYKVGDVIAIQVDFSEAVTVTGTPQLTLETGTTDRVVNYASGSGTSTLSFNYTIQAGDISSDLDYTATNALALNSGTIKDAAGNNATLTLASPGAANSLGANKSMVIDGVTPTVSSVSVPSNATYIAGQNLDFTINFSESITANTAGGTPILSLTIGSTSKSADYLSGSGSSALVFRYTVASGDLDANGIAVGSMSLNGGTLRDAAGNNATLTLNSVGSTSSVLVDAEAPTVSSVNAPANGTYKTGDQLNFTVNFAENVTVTGSPYLAITIGSSTVNASYALGSGGQSLVFRYTVVSGDADNDGVAIGALSLNGGTLKDAAGNNATLTLNSVASTASVLVDAVSPAVSSVSVPSNGTYITSQNLDFTVNFSENVSVNTGGGTPYIGLTIGSANVNAAYLSGSGTSALVFRYTVASGSADTDGVALASSVTLNGGTLRDAAGNNATLTLNSVGSTSSVLVDAVAPSVSSIARADASPTNSSSVEYTITFPEGVSGVGTNDFTVTSTGTASGSVALITAVSASVYTVTVNSISGNGTLRLDLNNSGTGITDVPGNAVSGGYTSGQTYTIDMSAPAVSSVSVPANGTYKTGNNLDFTINFTENVTVNTSSGTPYMGLTLNTGGTVNATYLSGSGTSALVFRYTIASGNLDTDGISVASAITANGGTLQDAVGNNATLTLNSVGSTASVLVDAVIPTLTAVGISSNNTTSTLAKTGDEITLSFTASEAINTPTVSIAGQNAGVVNTSGNIYTGKYTMTSAATEGTIAFSISFADAAGNSGTAVTVTTNSSAVTFDKTAPATPASLAGTSGDTQIVLNWNANSEADLKTYKVYGGTSANPTTLLQTIIAPTNTYTHTGLTNGTTYFYRISATDNAGNESAISSDATAVPKAQQNITFNTIAAKTYGDADFDAGATASSGLAVSYTSDNSAVATVISGKIHIVGNGTATITAAQAGNAAYNAAANQSQILTVNKKTLTVALTGTVSKTYDGTTTAALAAANYSLSGVVGSEAVILNNPTSGTYDDKNTGTGKTVSVTGLSISGADAGNYVLSATGASGAIGAISAKSLTASLTGTVSKTYDGTTSAALAADNYIMSGVIGTETVILNKPASGTYDTKNSGTGKIVSVTGLSISGADAGNYVLTATTTSGGVGTISAKSLTVSLSGTVTKTYDGNATATLVSGNYNLSGIIGSETVTLSNHTSGIYDDKHTGTGKTVSITGLSISGIDAGNYILSNTTANAAIGTITKKDITLTLNAAPSIIKEYDGTTSAILSSGNYSLNGLEFGDVVTISGTAVYDNKNAGVGKTVTANSFVVSGAQKDNYNLITASAIVTGAISTKTLTVTADDKTKFQNTANPALTVSYSGFISGEDKSNLQTQPFATTTASTASVLGTYPITASGGVAANYNFSYVNGTLTIVPGAPTSLSIAAATVYENQAAGTVAGTLSSTSDDPSASFTYTLVSGAGDTDNGKFIIEGNQIKTGAPLNFEQKSSYFVRLRSTTQHNLSLEKELIITISDVNEQPTLNDIDNQVICYTTREQAVTISGISAGADAGQSTTLSVSSTNNALFESIEVSQANSAANATVKYKLASGVFGSAVINVMVMDDGGTANGGVNTILKSFILQVNQLPEISISSNKGLELSKGEVTVLNADVTGGNSGLTYSWAGANGIVSGQGTQNLTVRPAETTTYKVTVTNSNNCSTVKEITISVNADYKVVNGTNLVSPNGDGVNDKLVIHNLDMYPKNEVKIFDRAGRLLYSQKNYTDQWDGTLNGSQLAEDTYYYVVDFGPGIEKIKGFISIVRD